MPQFGEESERRLRELDERLQKILIVAIQYVDFSITCGYRNEADQNKAVREGKSKTPWPRSKHNSLPSKAVDIAPWPCNWNDIESFTLLSGIIQGIAFTLGINIRLGIDWDGDGNVIEHSFKDRPHIELED